MEKYTRDLAYPSNTTTESAQCLDGASAGAVVAIPIGYSSPPSVRVVSFTNVLATVYGILGSYLIGRAKSLKYSRGTLVLEFYYPSEVPEEPPRPLDDTTIVLRTPSAIITAELYRCINDGIFDQATSARFVGTSFVINFNDANGMHKK